MLHDSCLFSFFPEWDSSKYLCHNCWCSLASYITDDAIRKGILFPSISRLAHDPSFPLLSVTMIPCAFRCCWLPPTTHCSIRHITARVGAAVAHAAVDEDLAEGCADVDPRDLKSMSEVRHRESHIPNVASHNIAWFVFFFMCSQSDTIDYVARKMWYPVYSPLVNDK